MMACLVFPSFQDGSGSLAWAVAATLGLVAAAFAVGFMQRAPEPPQLVRFNVEYPEGLPVVDSPKISPDGRYLAFNATDDQGKNQIWIRSLNALEAQPLAGTEGVDYRPFWSPDSRSLGFFADGKLKRIEVVTCPQWSYHAQC